MQTYKPGSSPPVRLTCLLYGHSRVGKTRWAAQWPRPIFISDGVEGGYETIGYMDRAEFFEKEYPPEVASPNGPDRPGIFSISDMHKALGQIRETVQQHPGRYRTVVVDSLSFISDLYEEDFSTRYRAEVEKNKWFLYGKLKSEIRHLMVEVHKLPVNVVWLCLATSSEEKDGGPMVAGGSMGKRLPAACNLILYMHLRPQKPGSPALREIRTRQYGPYIVGGRYGDALPDPLEPSYRALVAAITSSRPTAPAPLNGSGRVPANVRPAIRRPVQVRRP